MTTPRMSPLGANRPNFDPPARRDWRPHALYKAGLLEAVLAFAPASVLDVGAGQGDLLAALQARGCPRVIGLEVQPDGVAQLRARGIEAVHGFGEALPFDDASLDVVVLQYTAHHLADLRRSLREAARVARTAVLVLDPWYDVSIPSQRAALAYDDWCKVIDRRLGMIHNRCPDAEDLCGPLRDVGGFEFEIRHRLVLRMLDPEAVAAEAAAHLARLEAPDPVIGAALDSLLAGIARDGVSDDGAILLIAARDDLSA